MERVTPGQRPRPNYGHPQALPSRVSRSRRRPPPRPHRPPPPRRAPTPTSLTGHRKGPPAALARRPRTVSHHTTGPHMRPNRSIPRMRRSLQPSPSDMAALCDVAIQGGRTLGYMASDRSSSSGSGIVSFILGSARFSNRMKIRQFGAACISTMTFITCSRSFGCPKSGVSH